MIPLFKPYMPPLPDINNILYSGKLTYGEYSQIFEEKLKKYFHTDYVLVVNTFEAAINISLTVLGLKQGDEIITSPMACLASTQPLLTYGLTVVWADVDNHSGTLAPESVRSHITKKTKCIMHNHFCGFPGYIDEINKVANEFGIPIIDDGIECFGSEYHGLKIGNLGSEITIFSLSPVRIPNTLEGGIIVFNKKEIWEKAILARDYGINRRNFRDKFGEINKECDVKTLGYGAMPTNLLGYIGCEQMKYVDGLITRQRENSLKWDKHFEDLNLQGLNRDKRNNPNYWVYGMYVDNKYEFIKQYRGKGFYASGVHINNNRYSVFKNDEFLPSAEDFYTHFVALPCGWWLEEQI